MEGASLDSGQGSAFCFVFLFGEGSFSAPTFLFSTDFHGIHDAFGFSVYYL